MQYDQVSGKEVPQSPLNHEGDGERYQDGQGHPVPLDPANEGPVDQHAEHKHGRDRNQETHKEVKVELLLQPIREIGTQDDQDALSYVYDVKHTKYQGQP